MRMDDAVKIVKPAPDSHYRLLPCQCGSDNVAYVLGVDDRWHGQCFDCGRVGPESAVRHEAQGAWNRESQYVKT